MTRVKTIMERLGRYRCRTTGAHSRRFPFYAGEFDATTAYGRGGTLGITVQGLLADSSMQGDRVLHEPVDSGSYLVKTGSKRHGHLQVTADANSSSQIATFKLFEGLGFYLSPRRVL